MTDRAAQLPASVLRAAAAIVEAAADRTGNDHWRAMASRVRAVADEQAATDDTTTAEEADGE